jgi:hypothetical protein
VPQILDEHGRPLSAPPSRWVNLRLRTKVIIVMLTTLLAAAAVVISNLKSIGEALRPIIVRSRDPEVTVSYMRVFGASQMQALANYWSGDKYKPRHLHIGVFGPPAEGRKYSNRPDGWPDDYDPRESIESWYNKFAYGEARPIMNQVWDELAGKREYSGNLECSFKRLCAKCFAVHQDVENILSYFDNGGDSNLGPDSVEVTTVRKYGEDVAYEMLFSAMARIGFLILVLENGSSEVLRNVEIRGGQRSALDRDRPPSESDVESLFADGALRTSLNEPLVVMPHFFSGEQVVVILMAYWANDTGFGGRPLTSIDVPTMLCFNVGDSNSLVRHAIRPPLKDKAARIALPFGWYRQ